MHPETHAANSAADQAVQADAWAGPTAALTSMPVPHPRATFGYWARTAICVVAALPAVFGPDLTSHPARIAGLISAFLGLWSYFSAINVPATVIIPVGRPAGRHWLAAIFFGGFGAVWYVVTMARGYGDWSFEWFAAPVWIAMAIGAGSRYGGLFAGLGCVAAYLVLIAAIATSVAIVGFHKG